MKKILKTTILALLLISLGSCETDTHAVVSANGIELLSLNPSGPFVLSPEDGDNDVTAITWAAADNGVPTIASTYIVQIAKSGTNFAQPIIASPSSPLLTYTWKESYLDKILLDNGFLPGLAVDIDIRIQSTLGAGSNPFVQYSNIISASITPFAQPSFAFTKDGDDPANAPKLISSSLFTTDCEGYGWLEAGTYKFYTSVGNKYLTSNPYYGDNGSGALALNGNSINVTTAGFYLIKADTGLTTYSVTSSEWNIYGLSTSFPSANNKKMTYNSVTKNWEITATLSGGKALIFRNTGSTSQLGLYDATKVGVYYAGTIMSYFSVPPGGLAATGNVILVPGTTLASYKVSLDLNTPRAYTYSLVQQ